MSYWPTFQEHVAKARADGALWRREQAEQLIDERTAPAGLRPGAVPDAAAQPEEAA